MEASDFGSLHCSSDRHRSGHRPRSPRTLLKHTNLAVAQGIFNTSQTLQSFVWRPMQASGLGHLDELGASRFGSPHPKSLS
ncbi:MAG: hypothetical protein ACO4CG_08925, partial [Prochlorothrix sp.]